MEKAHCELLGYSILSDECVEMKSKEFFECQDCGHFQKEGENMGRHKKSREGVTCGACGKKAEDDQYFRFNKNRCCACLTSEIMAAKKAAEGHEVEPEKKKRKYTRKAAAKSHPLPDPLPDGEGKVGAGLNPAPTGNSKTITLDFSGHPELYETVTTIAREEMRTPENQILYFLKKGDFGGLSKVSA